jgi:hypothetical protein
MRKYMIFNSSLVVGAVVVMTGCSGQDGSQSPLPEAQLSVASLSSSTGTSQCTDPQGGSVTIGAASAKVQNVTVSCTAGSVAANALCVPDGTDGFDAPGAVTTIGSSTAGACPAYHTAVGFMASASAHATSKGTCKPGAINATANAVSCTADAGFGVTAKLSAVSASGSANKAFVSGTGTGTACYLLGVPDSISWTGSIIGHVIATSCPGG